MLNKVYLYVCMQQIYFTFTLVNILLYLLNYGCTYFKYTFTKELKNIPW